MNDVILRLGESQLKIESVRIRNFRAIEDVTIPFTSYTALVGPNGCGKSTIINALNIFFGQQGIPGLETTSLGVDDFHRRDTTKPIEITITFVDLSSDAVQELQHYVRQDKLVVSAVATFEKESGRAIVKQHGSRLVYPGFASFFEADAAGEKVGLLKEIYAVIKERVPELPTATTKDNMTTALRAYEEAHQELCQEMMSQDEFYGISRGRNRLEKFLQWVYIPAVKDAASESTESKNTALGTLLSRTVRAKMDFAGPIEAIKADLLTKYQELVTSYQVELDGISTALSKRIVEWSHDDAGIKLAWHQDESRAVRVEEPTARVVLREGRYEGDLTKFGHGLQRSFLFSLLQELAASDDRKNPTLILACEEPELYQHPPQARHVHSTVVQLAEKGAQVLVATHSPYFISGEHFESVRMVRKVGGRTEVGVATHDDVARRISGRRETTPAITRGQMAKVNQELQPALNEMFFANSIVFVEGLEDVAYITAYLSLMGKWDEFRRLGLHIVPTGGKSRMIRPIAVASCLKMPCLVVFDADGDKIDREDMRAMHTQQNSAILQLCTVSQDNAFPSEPLWADNCVVWPKDIGSTVSGEIGEDDWTRLREAADLEFGQAGGLQKNALHIALCLSRAWDEGKRSPSLQRLCEKILARASRP